MHKICLLVFGLGSALILSELLLRYSGAGRLYVARQTNEPVMAQPDALLGWANRAGRYAYPGYSSRVERVEVEIQNSYPRPTRITSLEPRNSGAQVVFIGDSFTFGLGLSNEQTFPWIFQGQHSDLQVWNLGVPGYSTYQALLTLREFLRGAASPPVLIVYGFLSFHDSRNVAGFSWLRSFLGNRSRGFASFPFCELDSQAGLACHGPGNVTAWMLPDVLLRNSALLMLMQDATLQMETKQRNASAIAVTKQLIVELNDLAQAKGSKLLVAQLDSDHANLFADFFANTSIQFAQCFEVDWRDPRMLIEGELHPNEDMNAYWASCIARRAGPLVSLAAPGGR